MTQPCRILLWADSEHESLVRDVLAQGDLEIVGVGSDSSAASSALSSAFNAERAGDLRQAIRQTDCDLVWLASPIALDTDTLRLIVQRERKVLTSAPQPTVARNDAHAVKERSFVRLGPLMRHSPGFRAAKDAVADTGPVEAVNVCVRCPAREGTLFTRLYDAMDVIDMLCGEPDVIDASLAGPSPAVPESIESLHGHITANLRFPEHRCASIFASDCGGSWFRGITIMTESGCLRVTDQQMAWINRADGETDTSDLHAPDPLPGALIADAIERWHCGRDHTEPPPDRAKLLAMCEATRLSCRTGEGEAPRTMLRMLQRP